MIKLAHSPDADDLFMYYAIVFGWVDSTNLRFSNTAEDIQTLNLATLKGIYDISAISFALYPLIAQDYALLRTGVSFGNGYGPKLIKKKNTLLKKHFKVALSGEHTTNAMIFRIAYPNARIVYKNFLQIEESVLNGEVDAGVLIHESILDFDDSLCVEAELWDIWQELSGGGLPLPLGGMALRRSLPLTQAIECENLLTKAVQLAVENKHILSQMLLERGIIRVDAKQLDTYLTLYANVDSISMNDKELEALNRLFALGYNAGYYRQKIKAQDYLIPTEYAQLRFS
ncbi:menaquinone biosynthesis family protein [Helicobacter marmotae]|uniref:1,4-dihydroxy-6-naphtoate synthase n=1 Tax=Helicobacter marmotae TaxID=152490 RepID=A0A3D8I354_9HELI|nr:MqnA/MqnD/SBP family protein [Helicobacter marmotae]RDU59515.1 S-ribosylhomocysteine lyase [Helicobacter marmotae]